MMILGAGIYQLPLILAAKRAGLQTVVVSPDGQYPGIALADIFVEIDTTTIDGVLAAARDLRIDAVVTTGTDVSVPTMGAIAETLGLPGPTRQAAETVSSKTAFRTFLRDNGFNCPEFGVCRCPEDAVDFCRSRRNATVVKPDDSSGSRGVTILPPGVSADEIREAYRHAANFSRSGKVCAEEFIPGKEVGGDAFLVGGSLGFFTTTCKHMDGVLVRGHSLPGDLARHQDALVQEEILRIASALEYRDGPMNFDVMVGDCSATAIEIGLRNGGNGILDLVYHSEGVDLYQTLIRYAMREPVSVGRVKSARTASSFVFGSSCAGVLKRVPSLAEIQRAVPEVRDMVVAKKLGDRVDTFVHNANLIGYLLLDCGAIEYPEVASRIRDVLAVEVSP